LVGKELDGSSDNRNYRQKGIDKYFEWPASAGADKNQFNGFMEKKVPMQAFKNAKWIKQKFPLVMLVHGYAADYAYLGEYLASFGNVVMQVPVKGTTQYELDYEGKGLETQVLDYEFALTVLQKEFPYLSGEAAVAGFSFGGQSAVALSLRNKSIKAVVSLEGGIGSVFGAQLLSNQSYYREKDIVAPILHLYNPGDPYTDLTWFNSIPYSERFLAAMKNKADPGNGYETVMLLTKEFLEQSLNKSLNAYSNFFDQQKKTNGWIEVCIAGATIRALGTS